MLDHGGVFVVAVDERLKVANFDVLGDSVGPFDERVELHLVWTVSVACEQLLDRVVTEKVLLRQPKNLKRLFLGDKSALDSKAFLSHLFPAVVTELLTLIFPQLFLQVPMHTCHPFFCGQRTHHLLHTRR